MSYALPIKKQNSLRKKIQAYVDKGLRDEDIGKKLNRTRTVVIYWRKKFQIRTNFNKSKSFKLRMELCRILNREDPHDCIIDKFLTSKLNKLGFDISHRSITRCRQQLKIPPARKIRNQLLTRQFLYFKYDRIVWMATGKHFYQKSKRLVNFK